MLKNLKYIETDRSSVVLHTGTIIPISQPKRKSFMEAMTKETFYLYLLCSNMVEERPSLKERWIPYAISYIAILTIFRFRLHILIGNFIVIASTSVALKCVYKSRVKDLLLVWCMWLLCIGIGNMPVKFLWAYFSRDTRIVSIS